MEAGNLDAEKIVAILLYFNNIILVFSEPEIGLRFTHILQAFRNMKSTLE